jgi:hypothetical protein
MSRTRPRATRCPCGHALVAGRCPPCDAIDASVAEADAARARRRELARSEQRVDLDRAAVASAARRLVPRLAREAEDNAERARRGRRGRA